MAPPDQGWLTWLDRLGWPLMALFLIGLGAFFGIRAIWRWFQPHLDKWIEARVAREKAMTESIMTMTEKTIEIQNATAAAVNKMQEKVPEICKFKP